MSKQFQVLVTYREEDGTLQVDELMTSDEAKARRLVDQASRYDDTVEVSCPELGLVETGDGATSKEV